MKILYVAPRYHTNQVPVMRGWKEAGVNVKFLVQYQGAIESHDYVDLQIIKPSFISRMMFLIFSKLYNPVKVENLKIRFFIPSFCDLYKAIQNFKPDVVIIRTFRTVGVLVNLVCNLLGIKNVVIYNQSPIYGRIKDHGTLVNRLEMFFAPSASFSPVLYRGDYRKKEIRTGLANHFIPLVCEKPQMFRSEYSSDDRIRILDIGKYREYKNHFFVVDAFSKVKHPENFEVTIIGQLSSKPEQDYHDRLEQYIKDKHLENIIHLRGHVDFKEMDTIYSSNDVLLLASKEPASISVLESMSHGLCVIGSYENGTTCYLDEYKCGFSFSNSQLDSLVKILDNLDGNRDNVTVLGKKAQQVAKEEFCFEKYKEHLNILLKKEYGYTIPV